MALPRGLDSKARTEARRGSSLFNCTGDWWLAQSADTPSATETSNEISTAKGTLSFLTENLR